MTTTHKIGLVFGTFALLVALAPTFVSWRRNVFQPPEGLATLADFAREESPPRRLAAVKVDDEKYYVWFGEYVLLAAPSGPSCFVFNSNGRLVAYTATTGDGELEQCDAAWKAPIIPVDVAVKETTAIKAEPSSSTDGALK